MATTNPVKEYIPVPEANGKTPTSSEEWRPIVYPNVGEGYQISSAGQVLGARGLMRTLEKSGQLWVTLKNDRGTSTAQRIDKLVLSTFVGPQPTKYAATLKMPQHLDGDPQNCQLDNLAWRTATKKERQSMRAAASRMVNQSSKGTTSTKTKASSPAGGRTRARAVPLDRMEISRRYRFAGLTVEVSLDGIAEIMVPKMPKIKLTEDQLKGLIKIAGQIEEMNKVMGR
jgi:hypothetical protein